MARRHWFHLMLVLFAGTALWAAAEPTPEEQEQNRVRVQAIRKNPERLAQLHKNLSAFLALNEKKKEAVQQLDANLHKLPATKQVALGEVLERYTEWLEQVKKSDPDAYQRIKSAPNGAARLALIKEQRDREWLDAQPKAHREALTKLQGDARTRYIADLRADERNKKQHWLIAARFWKELETKQVLPSRLADFAYKPTKGKDTKGKAKDKDKDKDKTPVPVPPADINPVKDYVEKYLFDQLTAAEKKQLEQAEGQWPEYPMTLVAIASKYPSALPMPKLPKKFKDLPEPVQKRFDKKAVGAPKAAKIKGEIEAHEGQHFANKFAEIVGREGWTFGRTADGNEFMACTFKTLTPPMQKFVDDELLPAIKKEATDNRKIIESSGKWPEYPETIQELSAKYGLRPPWHILPDADKFHWDRYRLDRGRPVRVEKAKEES